MKVKKNIFPKSTPRPFFESPGPDIRVYALVSFDISPPCSGNTPRKAKLYLEVCDTQGRRERCKKNPNHSGLLRILLGYKIVHFQVSVEKLASCNAGGT